MMMKKRWWRLPLVMLGITAICVVILGSVATAGGNSAVGLPFPIVTSTTTGSGHDSPTTPATTNAPSEPTEILPSPAVLPPPAPADVTGSNNRPPFDTAETPTPLRVRIPKIAVDAPIIDLGLNPDGTLEVPSDFDDAGWYTGRSVPGEVGPSVVVGHVDSVTGPAVFYRLSDLAVGDLIQIDRSDGLVAWFAVTKIVLVDKDEFPTEQVYGATDTPTLRLITCGGSFDREAHSYRSNVIVYAEHVGNYEPPPTGAPT